MKIAFDSQAFTMQVYGGVSRYYSILANELFRSKQDVKIFPGIYQNNYLGELPSSIVGGVKVNRYPPKSGRLLYCLNQLASQYQISQWKPDLVHETYFSSLPSLFSNHTARVATVHDMIHELFPDQFPRKDNTSKVKRKVLDRIDHIISISENTKRDLINIFGIDESKISVVHHGVTFHNFQLPKDSVNVGYEKPFLLYVGSRFGYKNFGALLKAIASSDKLQSGFDIVAFGGGGFSSDEKFLIKSLGFSDFQVRQCSGNDEELSFLYSKAAAFLYPSLYEGFGLPPLEAMAAGCPVVTSNTSSIPEVVRKAGVYFDPTEIDDICCAIERVVFSPSLTEELVLAGFENIKEFSWGKCASETLSVYQKVLTGL